MKKLFKKVSAIVCLSMATNLFFVVPNASAADSNTIYKTSFSDYVNNGSPSDWTKASYLVENGAEVANTESYAYAKTESGHNNILGINSNSSALKSSDCVDVVPFGKVISTGKLHISYDAKATNGDLWGGEVTTVLFNAGTGNDNKYDNDSEGVPNPNVTFGNYNPYDVNDFRGSLGEHISELMAIRYPKDHTGGKVYTTGSNLGRRYGCYGETGTVVSEDTWYHVDMIIDLDAATPNYKAWLNGNVLTESALNLRGGDFAKFKGLGFRQSNPHIATAYYDNIIVTHYTSKDDIQMVADAGVGVNAGAGGNKLVNVAFNDTLTYDLRPDDFKVTSKDGDTVSGVTILSQDKTKSGCVLDFTAATGLKPNTEYTVTFGTSSKGLATEADAKDATATFMTGGADVDTSADGYKYYYSKEDFNEYTDNSHLPFGFYSEKNFADTDTSLPILNKYIQKKTVENEKYKSVNGQNGENDKAIQLSGTSTLYHFFPRGVVAGDFTMEFDMNYSDGAWAIGLMPYRSWENSQVGLDNVNRTEFFRQMNVLLGASMGVNDSTDESVKASIAAPNLAINRTSKDNADTTSERSDCYIAMRKTKYNQPTGLTVTPGKWSHIKLDFDMAEGNVDIYITDDTGNVTSKTDVSYGDWNKFGTGVEGIEFFKGTSGTLNIDNFEVYSTSGRLLDQDFNGYKSTSQKRFPYFWSSKSVMRNEAKDGSSRNPLSAAIASTEDAYSVSGKTGADGDDAVKFTGNDKNVKWYTTRFAKPVPAGREYAVEFDLKYENDNTSWIYGPIDLTHTTSLAGYNESDSNQNNVLNNTCLLGMANKNFAYYKQSVQQNIYGGQIGDTWWYKTLSTDNGETEGTWRHYKIVAIPQDGKQTNYKLTITEDGQSTPREYEFTDNLSNNTKDIAGISFQAINAKTGDTEDWGVILDNVKAYLCDASGTELETAKENAILNIEAEKYDGKKVSLMNTDTIPATVKKITVTFSENLNEVRKQDLTPINVINGQRTGTVKGVYNCIEDVIQFRSENAQYEMGYTSEIVGNKYIITLTDTPQPDKKYSLHIAKDVNFASEAFSALDNGFSRTYTGTADAESGFIFANSKAVINTGTADNPVWTDITSYNDIANNESKLGLKINATNVTGEPKNIKAIVAFYDESGSVSRLVNVKMADAEFESGTGTTTEKTVAFDIPTLENGNSYTTVKFFAWYADTQKPLTTPQSFSNNQ